ncbi:MAG: hypothetical protein Q4P29_07860 [Tissierellia bacterium]|nr:hypothetical protein [Tissierellia bacterium]
MRITNPYFWKWKTIILKNKKKTLLLLFMPIAFSVYYIYSNLNLDYTVFWTAVNYSLISSFFLWDLEEILSYEYRDIIEKNRIRFISGYYIYSAIIFYILGLIESLIIMAILKKLSYALNINPLVYIKGLIFCIFVQASANAQIYNYRKWVLYSSTPISLSIIILPILSIIKNDFVIKYMYLIFPIVIFISILLLVLYILIYDSEKAVIELMKAFKGYGEMND